MSRQPNRQPAPDQQLPYPWLPADDECNVHSVEYCPTPEQIAREVAVFRRRYQDAPREVNVDGNCLAYVPRRRRGI